MRTQSERSANVECISKVSFKILHTFFVQPFLMSSKHLQCPFGVPGNDLHDEARNAEFTDGSD